MYYVRIFYWLFFLVFTTSALATPLWGNPEKPTLAVKGIWGKERPFLQESNDDSYESAGLFFFHEESEEEISLPPWLEYAVSVPDVPQSRPMIAIVIDDLGLNKKMTREVISLPAPLTASFLYYADDLKEQTEAAQAAGHELLLHTPMQPVNARFNPGPLALRTDMTSEDIKERLQIMLDSFSGYVGINNHMGSRFTADRHGMRIVMDEIKNRGLLFLDSLTSPHSIAADIAQEKEIPYAVRNVFLDNSHNEKEILKQLLLLEKHADRHRFAVGIGHPHKATINALKKWIPQAQKRGFVFVPISLIAVYMQDEAQAENVQPLNLHDEWE